MVIVVSAVLVLSYTQTDADERFTPETLVSVSKNARTTCLTSATTVPSADTVSAPFKLLKAAEWTSSLKQTMMTVNRILCP